MTKPIAPAPRAEQTKIKLIKLNVINTYYALCNGITVSSLSSLSYTVTTYNYVYNMHLSTKFVFFYRMYVHYISADASQNSMEISIVGY